MMSVSSGNRPALAASLLLLSCACSRAPQPSASAPAPTVQARAFGALVVDGLARARAATAAFVVLDSAVAAGYARDVPRCFVDTHHGAMGFHHLNRGYVDARVEVERPEILLYERHPDGRYVLNGMEYIIPYRVWPADSTPPTIMGQQLMHQEELNLWYLHMWAWTDNASGLFADYNPAVRCPEGTEARLRDAS